MNQPKNVYKKEMELNLLCIDINTREPAAKSRMRMVPADNHLWSATQETNINEFINQTSLKYNK